jgi:hypothetical protein
MIYKFTPSTMKAFETNMVEFLKSSSQTAKSLNLNRMQERIKTTFKIRKNSNLQTCYSLSELTY